MTSLCSFFSVSRDCGGRQASCPRPEAPGLAGVERRRNMKIEAKDAGGVRILDLHGKILIGKDEEDLARGFKECLAQGHRQIVLMLGHVSAMDSAGLGQIVACKKRAMDKDGNVKLVLPKSSSISMVVRTCLHFSFEIFDDELTAVGSFVK
jgi:anti-sigma B factor antagonist